MRSLKQYFKIIVFLFIVFLAFGCRSSRVIPPSRVTLLPDFCVPVRVFIPDSQLVIYRNTDSVYAHEKVLHQYMGKREILFANASGSLDLLHKLLALLQDSMVKNKDYFEYTTDIDKNLALIRSEIDILSTSLECESIRCRQLSGYLAGLNSKKNSKLTVAAIIVGSATTITPIFVKQTAPQNIVLISGGIISAGLGLLTLNPSGKQIQLVTPNNMLTDLWYGNKTSQVYPPPIWYILNDPNFSNTGLVSKRMLITMRWMKFDLGGTPDHQTEELLFGESGLYDQSTLDTRASMLSEVMAHINSIKKDLDGFSYALNNLKMKVILKMNQ